MLGCRHSRRVQPVHVYSPDGVLVMAKPTNWGDEEKPYFWEGTAKRSSFMPNFNTCGPNFVFVPDADNLNTFLKYAEKYWRITHPVKRGPRSKEVLVFEECILLYETGKISEKLSIEKISNEVTNSLEKKQTKKIPYEKTILKHVREWRNRTRELIAKGCNIKEIREILLKVSPRRPYDPWDAKGIRRKK